MIDILRKNKREGVENLLERVYGLKIPFRYHLLQTGKDKIRVFTGNLPANDTLLLGKILNVETVGLYLAFLKDSEIRLGFDSSTLLGKHAKKFIELSNSEAKKWLRGEDIEKETDEKGYFLMKHGPDIIGCGKATGQKILNFVPKERRIP